MRAADAATYVAEIERLTHSVPPNYGTWSVNQSWAYKTAALKALAEAKAKKPNAQKIEQAARDLRRAFES